MHRAHVGEGPYHGLPAWSAKGTSPRFHDQGDGSRGRKPPGSSACQPFTWYHASPRAIATTPTACRDRNNERARSSPIASHIPHPSLHGALVRRGRNFRPADGFPPPVAGRASVPMIRVCVGTFAPLQFDPPASDDEGRAASVQFVRTIGFASPRTPTRPPSIERRRHHGGGPESPRLAHDPRSPRDREEWAAPRRRGPSTIPRS